MGTHTSAKQWARFDAHQAGLPDGIFSNQKFQFVQILEGSAMEDVKWLFGLLGIFYCRLVYLVYFMAIWSIWFILGPFSIFFLF
jgi:hypothetical protein